MGTETDIISYIQYSEVYGSAYYIMEVKECHLGQPGEDRGNWVRQGFSEILKQPQFQDLIQT